MSRPTPSTIRVLLVDDHEVFRQGLAGLFLSEAGMTLVGEAASCRGGLDALTALSPDVAVVDLSLPDASGADLVRQAQTRGSQAAFVVLTSAQDPKAAAQALDQGVLGYVMKDDAFEEVAGAIRFAYQGKPFLSRSISTRLLKYRRGAHRDPLNALTVQEIEVLRLVASDLTNQNIADQLGIGLSTVKSHRLSLRQKLHLPGTAELTRFAIRHGLISAD